jgi:FAD/FMN-containing dehydrogenase
VPSAPPSFNGAFYTDLPTRAAYSEGAGPFRIVPEAVAVPRDLDDLRRLVNQAIDRNEALIPRGAGSGIPGNNVGAGIVVDMGSFVTPMSITPDGLANVGAAVNWATLDRAARAAGFRVAPNPSSGQCCTLGGMVATNAAGARSVRTGSVRRWIRGAEMVTGDGEIGWFGRSGQQRRVRRTPVEGQDRWHNPLVRARKRFDEKVRPALNQAMDEIQARFPQTTKNSAGYALNEYLKTGDLLDLIIGSEGTLGIVSRLAIELERLPGATASVLLALKDLSALPASVAGLLELRPAAVELMDRTLLNIAADRLPFPLESIEAVLLVDFEGADASEVTEAVEKAKSTVGKNAARFESALTEKDRDRLWAVRHAASPTLASLPAGRRSLQIVEDGCVPVSALDRYVRGVRAASERHGIEVVAFGHAGDGHLHVNALTDIQSPDFTTRLSRLLDDVTALVSELGGTPSGEHGDGRLRAPVLERVYGSKIVRLFEQVKKAFDPVGIMNPGVILPKGGGKSLDHLKVGPRTQPIPGEIEQRLREVERSAQWNVPKHELASRQSTGG